MTSEERQRQRQRYRHRQRQRHLSGYHISVEGVVSHAVSNDSGSDGRGRNCICPNCKASPGGHIYGYGLDLEDVPKRDAPDQQQDWHEWIHNRLYALGREGAGKRVRLTFEVIDVA